jgi:DNA-binding beta-propeller fold protein YncE
VDAASGQIVGSVKLGGYLTDLVADEKRQRLLVADAWDGRIVVIDAKTLSATAETKVPQVWSLALTPDNKLVAVSRSERQLLVLDAETMKPLQKNRFASATDANFCDDGEGRNGVSHEPHFGCCRF